LKQTVYPQCLHLHATSSTGESLAERSFFGKRLTAHFHRISLQEKSRSPGLAWKEYDEFVVLDDDDMLLAVEAIRYVLAG
jgi:hypothetical protein